ncbi:hypothetical protein QBC40DRAFT_260620 [Triangularia verruculosa]|uniref:Uncharacterized protein n=1 Tax=Triangularia verruculosa TaxID=2587418 RepID=A0AAN7AY56_9PEZI|nr:hypothetical protein QBC40DRAFT_260620 [Triangularia verruculosa]
MNRCPPSDSEALPRLSSVGRWEHSLVPHLHLSNITLLRTPRLILLGGSAITSFVTGMTALQLEIPHDPEGTKLAKMSLRITSSTFLGLLIVGYSLWFLRFRAQKTQRFLYALCGIDLILWVFVRHEAASDTDAFTWLDGLNLFSLVAVLCGILNAESRLITSVFEGNETASLNADDAENPDRRSRDNHSDEESIGEQRNDNVSGGELSFVPAVARSIAGI